MFCDYLHLPEDAACVSVVVLSQRNVLHSTLVSLQVALHVFEEPGFKVQPDSVNLVQERRKEKLHLITHVKTKLKFTITRRGDDVFTVLAPALRNTPLIDSQSAVYIEAFTKATENPFSHTGFCLTTFTVFESIHLYSLFYIILVTCLF